MKMRLPHRVPLSRQSLVVIEELRPLTGNLKHLFPSSRDPDQPAPKNRIGRALVVVGYGGDRHGPPGFRSTFSTIANESGKWSPDVMELQLAHVESNKVRRDYNRNVRWDERVELMSWYADYLDELRERVSAGCPLIRRKIFFVVDTSGGPRIVGFYLDYGTPRIG